MEPFLVNYPSILKLAYPHRLSSIKASSKTLYLTFDDGPIPEITPWVLEKLKEFNAKATFFCIGENVRKHPAVFNEILAENHQIGNHTFHHLQGWKTKTNNYLENVQQAAEMISKRVQENPSQKIREAYKNINLFRPPYGKIKNKQASKLTNIGFRIVMWQVISGDFSPNINAEDCYRNVVHNAKEGNIIVFHDSWKAFPNLKEVLPRVLEFYQQRGFQFKSL